MTENVPQGEVKTSSKKLHSIAQKIKNGSQKIHRKIGIYGWIAAALLILLITTIIHYETREVRHERRPYSIYHTDDWIRDIDRDFENMHRQMDIMRTRHERMMRDVWEAPIDTKAMTTSIVSNGDFQYSVNTKDGKLDGFVSMSDIAKVNTITTQIKGLGLNVDQKNNKVFFDGDAGKLHELLGILGK